MPASAADSPSFASRLLAHYDRNARDLPWRAPPGAPAPDPYPVWLSEVMLQQTTVAAVEPRFRRFLSRWPTLEALAAAEEADLLSEWAGLGYYARARNLHACAKAVAAAGGFPAKAEELRALPGIGDYTAAAIAAIAFGQPVAVIDTNVERVIARQFGMSGPLTESRPRIRQVAKTLTPSDRPGDFAQAMMDLGATICRPRTPNCGRCPVREGCIASASGTPETYPAPKPRPLRPRRHAIAWWIERGGALWLVRRPRTGVLAGMAALPGPPWSDDAPPGPALARIGHGFTHFMLEMAIQAHDPIGGEGWWQPLDRIGEAGLPTLYRRAVEAVIARRTQRAA